MKTSWKTSALGLVAILTAVANAGTALLDSNPATVFDLDQFVTAVAAGIGLLFARDNNVTSESAGAK